MSRSSELSLQCYLRKDEPKRGADGLADEMGNNDIFLGGLKITPDFDSMGSQDQWYDLAGGSGKVKLGVTYQPTYVRLNLFVMPSLLKSLSYRANP